jgi:hypothetical protein
MTEKCKDCEQYADNRLALVYHCSELHEDVRELGKWARELEGLHRHSLNLAAKVHERYAPLVEVAKELMTWIEWEHDLAMIIADPKVHDGLRDLRDALAALEDDDKE